MNSNSPFIIQLMITEQCNLRCNYCFEIDKGPRTMPVELAKKLLDQELSQQSEFEDYQIELSGGEPFLHFEELKEIVEYGIENAYNWRKKVYFFITSNLTLLDRRIEEWLEERKDYVILGTSLDGTKEAHDYCRCNSYDDVISHIPFYKKLYPLQGAKMTIGPSTIKAIFDGIINIESLGLDVSANVVFEPVWGDSDSKKKHLKQFAEQLDLLVYHYVDNPNLKIPNLLSLPIQLILGPKDLEHGWCGSGRMMTAYDTDGRKLPCHRFSRFCSKKIYNGPQSIGQRVTTPCDNCTLIAACPTCSGYNWQVFGHPDSRTSNHCEFIKLQFLAAAKLIFLRNELIISQLINEPKNAQNIPIKTLLDIQAAQFIMHTLDEDAIISAV